MRSRAELLSILWLSVIGLSVLGTGCFEDNANSEEDGGAGKGGKGGSAGKGGSGSGGEVCGGAGGGGRSGSCSRAGTGGVGGIPGEAGNGPWPPFGQPVNGECGAPPAPRWGFELYEDAKQIAIPSRGPKDLDVTGQVVEVGDGTPDDLGRSNEESDVRYVRVQASSHTYTLVSYGVPGLGATLTPGTEVSLSHHDDTCEYILCAPGNIGTALRAGDKDVIRYVFTSSGEPMVPEGYSIEFGDELCEGRTYCIAWTGHNIDVTSPSGVTLEFAPGKADELGDYTIYAGMSRRHEAKNNMLEPGGVHCGDVWVYSPKELLFVRFE